ncbi:MAG: carotenoid oxygenase family protein [Sandaracinaceae bacterium]
MESLAAHEDQIAPDVRMSRLEIDPVARRLSIEPITDVVGEQPRIDPFREQRPSRLIHHVGFSGDRGLSDRVVQLDTERGVSVDVNVGDGVYPSEPVYLPRSERERDGWVLSLVFDPTRSRSGLAVADAARPGDGPLATAWLDHHVPPPFHGT